MGLCLSLSLSLSLSVSLSEYRSEQCVPQAGVGMQVCSIHGPKAEQIRAAHAVITFGRVYACVELNQSRHSD